jgi:hypothetical protein
MSIGRKNAQVSESVWESVWQRKKQGSERVHLLVVANQLCSAPLYNHKNSKCDGPVHGCLVYFLPCGY